MYFLMDDPWLHDTDFLKIIDVLLYVIFAGIYSQILLPKDRPSAF